MKWRIAVKLRKGSRSYDYRHGIGEYRSARTAAMDLAGMVEMASLEGREVVEAYLTPVVRTRSDVETGDIK